MNTDYIFIKGAREHNLKNIDVKIPRNKLVVITGLSGSGKSSLAFDTLYAEGQRRYVESLSAYARQFLGMMEKPDVDHIEGISPAISIDQKGISKNPRSTVGTITEIYDYLRLLYARIGVPHCYKCGRVITTQTVQQMVDRILKLPESTKIQLLAPVVRGRKGTYQSLLSQIKQKGFTKLRANKILYDIEENIVLDRYKKHDIEVVVDRLIIKEDIKTRLADSLETALKLSDGYALVLINEEEEVLFSRMLTCPKCSISIEELQPRMFSFNSPYGACPECTGLGYKIELDPDLVVPDTSLSITEGAIKPWKKPVFDAAHHAAATWFWKKLFRLAGTHNIALEKPFGRLTKKQEEILLHGSDDGDFEGAIPNLERRYTQTDSEAIRTEIEKYMAYHPCPSCKGARLKKEALSVKVQNLNISQMTSMSISDVFDFLKNLSLKEKDKLISAEIIKEIMARLIFLKNVGLNYLTLNRPAQTLAGGESQRIRLATQIGSGLVGVLYILDEPSIGLHSRDTKKLLETLTSLRDLGNTVIVIEHDEETIKIADHIIDIGPGAGAHGGKIVFTGTPKQLVKDKKSLTGRYLSGKIKIKVPEKRRKGSGKFIEIIGAEEHNLKNINVAIPLGAFTCVTGVSGSGKSTLINDILYNQLAHNFYRTHIKAGKHKQIKGADNIDKIIVIDQSPIGRTPRSNPATYTGAFDPVRTLFSQTYEARMRGYKPGRFSFNVPGGRCEACQGQGILKIEMHFLPDVYVPCEVCKGKRYGRETLEVYYNGKNISEVLNMTVAEALDFFKAIPQIKSKLQTLYDVGLGYIKLGQSATTLSGGEAQRIKLAAELAKRATGKTLYILDEPTTGLHFHDIYKLLGVLNRLTDAGNSVIIIEHNPDIIKCADYIIDLGPEGGDKGGRIVAEGTPEKVSLSKKSYTGQLLKKVLK
ncbi:MAG: excinuclease ABC subunit UvrA [Armatimonadota bacterium]